MHGSSLKPSIFTRQLAIKQISFRKENILVSGLYFGQDPWANIFGWWSIRYNGTLLLHSILRKLIFKSCFLTSTNCIFYNIYIFLRCMVQFEGASLRNYGRGWAISTLFSCSMKLCSLPILRCLCKFCLHSSTGKYLVFCIWDKPVFFIYCFLVICFSHEGISS